METIDLDIDETNELSFKLKIEGTAHGGRVTARLFCENQEGTQHAFSGCFGQEADTVVFQVPRMHNVLSEGTYSGWVEVVVDSKQFVPIKFDIAFKKPVNVQMESLTKAKPAKPQSTVQVESIQRVVKAEPGKQTLKEWYKSVRNP